MIVSDRSSARLLQRIYPDRCITYLRSSIIDMQVIGPRVRRCENAFYYRVGENGKMWSFERSGMVVQDGFASRVCVCFFEFILCKECTTDRAQCWV